MSDSQTCIIILGNLFVRTGRVFFYLLLTDLLQIFSSEVVQLEISVTYLDAIEEALIQILQICMVCIPT